MKEINHVGAAATPAHYSAAVREGNWMYISGQLPLNPATREPCEGDVCAQTRKALENLEALIKQEGGDRNCVVRTTAYITRMEDWAAVNAVYREFFGEHRPARTIAAVSEIHFGFLVEIDGVAVLPHEGETV